MELVTLATFNIKHGEGLDHRVDLDRTAGAISETGASFIALQELDRGNERSGRVDQPERLAERTGLEIAFWPTVRRGRWEYGIGIASVQPVDATYTKLPRIAGEEPRGAVVGRLPGTDLSFVATHLSVKKEPRRVQTGTLLELASDLEPPVVIMGDLNQGRMGLRPVIKAGFDAGRKIEHTLTTRSLRWQIDFVLVGSPARLVSTHTVTTDASDHVPLVAEVALEPT